MSWGLIIFGIFVAVLALLIALNFSKVAESFRKLKVYFGEISLEMQKVTWPSREEVINSTILVVVSSFALTIVLWIVDFVIGRGISLIF